ncbi:lysophospholipid acyltransferase family protein [Haloactinopolyspora alba]|uniref:lysophospholipid acyltransferase family protein n=1 Tax=Haloactinopolyspora alba TaxID=648780 RepID=UPI000D0D7917|nr:lysophospholipid acyltransferase family protein [Haloactinopolyspora alba]
MTLPTRRGAAAGRWIATGLLRTLWSVRVDGADHVPAHGPVILAPNHAGFIDAPLLMATSPRPVHTLAKRELFRGPMGWLLRGVGQIPLDRDDPGRGLLKAGVGVLDDGRVLVVFPEGTRGSGDFSELRTGLAWFALRSGAPVVPVVFSGTSSRGRTLGGMPGLRSRLDVVFGPPVHLPSGGRTRAALDAATDQLREALVAHRQAVADTRPEEPT